MMRKTISIALLVLAAAAGSAQTGAGWKSLFNGKDLGNWNLTGNADWQVKDGVIEATKARGFLVTKESYTDFEFRADVWTTPDSNGGLLFRITKPEDPGIENGYELNINDKRADQTGRTGSIVNDAKPLVRFDAGGKSVTAVISSKGPHLVGTFELTKRSDDYGPKHERTR